MLLSLPSLALLATTALAKTVKSTFHPDDYTKKFVTCPAVERDSSGKVTKNIDLKLAYIDVNPTAEKTLIMLHGWPSLWTTYRKQIQTLGKEYRLILPENRGYGDSEHPKDLFNSNTFVDFVNDVECVMDHAKVEAGVCIGNDFGGQLCWQATRERPDRFIGLFNIGTPYFSSEEPFLKTKELATLNPSFGYQVYVSDSVDAATKEMDGAVRDVLRGVARTKESNAPKDFLISQDNFLQAWYDDNKKHGRKEIPKSGIMSDEVEDYMVKSYKKQGFYNTYNAYQDSNRRLAYEFDRHQGNYTIPQPVFFLAPTSDPVADWDQLATMLNQTHYVKNYHHGTISTAHWAHEEDPAGVDRFFHEWIGNVTFPAPLKSEPHDFCPSL